MRRLLDRNQMSSQLRYRTEEISSRIYEVLKTTMGANGYPVYATTSVSEITKHFLNIKAFGRSRHVVNANFSEDISTKKADFCVSVAENFFQRTFEVVQDFQNTRKFFERQIFNKIGCSIGSVVQKYADNDVLPEATSVFLREVDQKVFCFESLIYVVSQKINGLIDEEKRYSNFDVSSIFYMYPREVKIPPFFKLFSDFVPSGESLNVNELFKLVVSCAAYDMRSFETNNVDGVLDQDFPQTETNRFWETVKNTSSEEEEDFYDIADDLTEIIFASFSKKLKRFYRIEFDADEEVCKEGGNDDGNLSGILNLALTHARKWAEWGSGFSPNSSAIAYETHMELFYVENTYDEYSMKMIACTYLSRCFASSFFEILRDVPDAVENLIKKVGVSDLGNANDSELERFACARIDESFWRNLVEMQKHCEILEKNSDFLSSMGFEQYRKFRMFLDDFCFLKVTMEHSDYFAQDKAFDEAFETNSEKIQKEFLQIFETDCLEKISELLDCWLFCMKCLSDKSTLDQWVLLIDRIIARYCSNLGHNSFDTERGFDDFCDTLILDEFFVKCNCNAIFNHNLNYEGTGGGSIGKSVGFEKTDAGLDFTHFICEEKDDACDVEVHNFTACNELFFEFLENMGWSPECPQFGLERLKIAELRKKKEFAEFCEDVESADGKKLTTLNVQKPLAFNLNLKYLCDTLKMIDVELQNMKYNPKLFPDYKNQLIFKLNGRMQSVGRFFCQIHNVRTSFDGRLLFPELCYRPMLLKTTNDESEDFLMEEIPTDDGGPTVQTGCGYVIRGCEMHHFFCREIDTMRHKRNSEIRDITDEYLMDKNDYYRNNSNAIVKNGTYFASDKMRRQAWFLKNSWIQTTVESLLSPEYETWCSRFLKKDSSDRSNDLAADNDNDDCDASRSAKEICKWLDGLLGILDSHVDDFWNDSYGLRGDCQTFSKNLHHWLRRMRLTFKLDNIASNFQKSMGALQ